MSVKPACPSAVRNNEETRLGAAAAVSAILFWGLIPAYWKLLDPVNPLEVVCHRGLWSLVCMLPIIVFSGRMPEVTAALRGRSLLLMALATFLLTLNWIVLILAISQGKILEVSLGNFIGPLFNMLCGVIFFKDRLTGWQWAAIALVAFSVLVRVVALGQFPWLGLSLCATFSCYAIIKKIVSVESAPGLLVENLLFAPFALAFLAWLHFNGGLCFAGGNTEISVLLAAAGPVTCLPMFLFAYGARHLKLTSLGLVMYLAPTCTFILGVFVYREPFSHMHAVTFAIIWLALLIYTAEKLRGTRRV